MLICITYICRVGQKYIYSCEYEKVYSCITINYYFILFFNILFYFLETGEGREKKKERNINVWLLLMCPTEDLAHKPRHVPQQVIKPVTLYFTVWHAIHWATPARAIIVLFSIWTTVTLLLPHPVYHLSIIYLSIYFYILLILFLWRTLTNIVVIDFLLKNKFNAF